MDMSFHAVQNQQFQLTYQNIHKSACEELILP